MSNPMSYSRNAGMARGPPMGSQGGGYSSGGGYSQQPQSQGYG